MFLAFYALYALPEQQCRRCCQDQGIIFDLIVVGVMFPLCLLAIQVVAALANDSLQPFDDFAAIVAALLRLPR